MVMTAEPTHSLGGNRERFDMDVKEIRRRNLMYSHFESLTTHHLDNNPLRRVFLFPAIRI